MKARSHSNDPRDQNIEEKREGMGITHVLDGLTSSTFRSNWCHVGVAVEGVRDICAVLKDPTTTDERARRASYKISRHCWVDSYLWWDIKAISEAQGRPKITTAMEKRQNRKKGRGEVFFCPEEVKKKKKKGKLRLPKKMDTRLRNPQANRR